MTGEVELHQTEMVVIQSVPPEVYAGAEMPLTVKVSCASGCDLRGKKIRIEGADGGVTIDVALGDFQDQVNETRELKIKAPLEPGPYTYAAVFPAQEDEEVVHEESSAPFGFTVKPHATSLAVWDIPSPVGSNANFRIKAGVKCSAGCELSGAEIEVYDEKGELVGSATLGQTPVQQTSALYWAEVELKAPDAERHHAWVVGFADPGLGLAHQQASYTFRFTTARPPEHAMTAEVIDRGTQTPLKNARVMLRASGVAYRTLTDDTGMATLNVPKGKYILHVMALTYQDFETTVDLATDGAIKVQLSPAPHTPFGH